jgi:hypothetical protein
MQRLAREGFVLRHNLELREMGGGIFEMSGDVECDGGILLEVQKMLRIVEGEGREALVRTVEYSYNAKLSGIGNILRYCSPHEDGGATHHAEHHKHCFDDVAAGGDRVEVIEDDKWPTLGQVLEELRGWLSDHADLAQPTHTRRG